MSKYKKEHKLYDVQFSEVARDIQAFIKSVFYNGYWD